MHCQSALSTTGSVVRGRPLQLGTPPIVGWSIVGTCAGTFGSQRSVDTQKDVPPLLALSAQRYGGMSDRHFKAPFVKLYIHIISVIIWMIVNLIIQSWKNIVHSV